MAGPWIGPKVKKTKQSVYQLGALGQAQWKWILIAIAITVYIASWILIWQFLYQLESSSWWQGLLWAALPAGLVAALLLYLYEKQFGRKSTKAIVKSYSFIMLIIASFAIPGIPLAAGFLTLAPPTPGPPGAPIVNATLEVRVPGKEFDITGLCEVKLWQTYNATNVTTWSIVDLSGNSPGANFYKNGWLNAAFFNQTLSGKDSENRSVAYWLQTRAWWRLSEWVQGTYTPPGWWTPWVNISAFYLAGLKPYLEENETCVTWNRIENGTNIIYLYTEPYTLMGKIEDPITFQRWNSSNGAYTNNYTNNWEISINLPANESYRGFNQEYDWLSQRWYGCWLIASSNSSVNINQTYTDIYGTTFPLWFNVTNGIDISGAMLNNSIVTSTTYDIAFLLTTFNYNLQFSADIQIRNGSNGIYWYFGKGFEDNIQLITQL